jgi:ABC-type transporter Mla subunit MlaD
VAAAHDADTRQFIEDLAALTGELADRAPDVVRGATDLNAALPVLIGQKDDLTTVLDQAARLSGDLADVLEHNRGFLRKSAVMGGDAVQALYDQRSQIGPLITGLRQYVQTIAEATGIPLDDGTLLARVRAILGGSPCGHQDPLACVAAGDAADDDGGLPLTVPQLPITIPEAGVDGISGLLEQVLG